MPPLVSILLLCAVCSATVVCNLKEFGGVGDGIFDNTQVLRSLLGSSRRCHTVLVPGNGTFATGPVNITGTSLQVEGTLLAINSTDNWPVMPHLPSYPCDRDLCTCCRYQPFVLFYNATAVSLTGSGTIDGSGPFWWNLRNKKRLRYGRPRLVETMFSSQVLIRGLTLKDSGFWVTHIWASDQVEVAFVNVSSRGGANTDGFDPDSSTNVHIHDCIVSNSDDCISVKSGMDAPGRAFGRPSRNILIENLQCFRGGGLAMGSEISGGIENVVVRNVTVTSNAHGAYIKANNQRGGYIRNVTYENNHFVNTSDVIRIWGTFESHIFGTHYPDIGDVNFISLTGVGGGRCGSLDCYLLRP